MTAIVGHIQPLKVQSKRSPKPCRKKKLAVKARNKNKAQNTKPCWEHSPLDLIIEKVCPKATTTACSSGEVGGGAAGEEERKEPEEEKQEDKPAREVESRK